MNFYYKSVFKCKNRKKHVFFKFSYIDNNFYVAALIVSHIPTTRWCDKNKIYLLKNLLSEPFFQFLSIPNNKTVYNKGVIRDLINYCHQIVFVFSRTAFSIAPKKLRFHLLNLFRASSLFFFGIHCTREKWQRNAYFIFKTCFEF